MLCTPEMGNNGGPMSKHHFDQRQELLLVTIGTRKQETIFRDPACAREAIESLYRIQWWNPFVLFGFVILPNQCQFLIAVKRRLHLVQIIDKYKRAVAFNLEKPKLWEKEFRAREISPEEMGAMLQHMATLPVEDGLCLRPEQYRWSSACGRWDVLTLECDSLRRSVRKHALPWSHSRLPTFAKLTSTSSGRRVTA